MATFRKLKSNKWQVIIRKNNYPHVVRSFLDKSTAVKFAKDVETKMDKMIWDDFSQAQSTTLKDILLKYREEITIKKKGWKEETPKINLLMRHKISSYSLMQLRSSHLYKFKEEMLIDRAPKTVNNYLQLISHVWKTAKKVWSLTLPAQNPVDLVVFEKVNNKRENILTREEYQSLLNCCTESKLNTLVDIVKFAYLTGARLGEITKLKRDDINFNEFVCTFRDTKNSEDRTIPLSNEVIDILKKYPFGETVFQIKREQLRFYFVQARKKANLTKFRFHDLRACFCTNALLSGMSIAEVSSISGHKSWSQLKRYTRIKPSDLLQKINNILTMKK